MPTEYKHRPPEAMFRSLDMTNGNHRESLRRRLEEKRWGELDQAFKADAVKALRVALRWALEGKDARAIRGIVQVLGILEAQNQSDDHLLLKLAEGDPDAVKVQVQTVIYNVPPDVQKLI